MHLTASAFDPAVLNSDRALVLSKSSIATLAAPLLTSLSHSTITGTTNDEIGSSPGELYHRHEHSIIRIVVCEAVTTPVSCIPVEYKDSSFSTPAIDTTDGRSSSEAIASTAEGRIAVVILTNCQPLHPDKIFAARYTFVFLLFRPPWLVRVLLDSPDEYPFCSMSSST